MPAPPLSHLIDQSSPDIVETALSACRIDVDDREHLSAASAHTAIAETTLQAMLDVFRPLSRSLEVYVTR